MRKNLLILATVLAVSYSCSNDEVIETAATSDSNAISFRALNTGVTRAADQSFSVTSTATQFKVTAFNHTTPGEAFFSGIDFKGDGSTYWVSDGNKYYWPSGYNLDFYAYAPINGAPATSFPSTITPPASNHQIIPDNTIGYKKFQVTPSAVVTEQVDLVYANTNQWGKYNESGYKPGGSGVTINFRHAGAKICVMVKNTNTSLEFDVSGWKLANVDGQALYEYSGSTDNVAVSPSNLPHTDATPTGYYLKYSDWSNNTDAKTASYTTSDFTTTNTVSSSASTAFYLSNDNSQSISTVDEDLSMILVPQTTSALPVTSGYSGSTVDAAPVTTGSYIALKMVIKNSSNSSVVADCTTNWAMWPVAFDWKPGKKYIYTIDLAGGGYWEKNTNTTDANLDPILDGAEIKFVTVTVDGWDDVANNVSFP